MRLTLRFPTLFKDRSLSGNSAKSRKKTADYRRARLLLEKGKLWDAFQLLSSEYKKNPTRDLGKELSELIGTITPYSDVIAAMEAEFDNEYYLKDNPDVTRATTEGARHYLLYGWKENRNPSAFFNAPFYRYKNPDLESNVFLLSHFHKSEKLAGIITNPISDKYWFLPTAPSEESWGRVQPAMLGRDTQAIVVIPVYKGYEETMRSVYQALLSRDGDPYSLLVVNDRSPDEHINAALRLLADRGLFDYHVNSANRGFVQTCNHAIEKLTGSLDVVLLNSDAYVFPGWFHRLSAHAVNAGVATVTPLSNNATICSYPLSNRDNFLALEYSPERLDAIAAEENRGLSVEAPTGVGFCFYMKRSVINLIGTLDAEAFKVGYGEENDFCMRALIQGYKNLIAGDVFVFHTGSVSFATIKNDNFDTGQKSLGRKHPNYSQLIRNHAIADPEKQLRRRLDARRLAMSLGKPVVFITHKWSGGINTYLDHQREMLNREERAHITVRVHDGHKVSIDTHFLLFVPNLSDIDLRTDFAFLTEFLRKIDPAYLHINSFAGLEWYWHRRILELIQAMGANYTYVCHDYSPISHHYQLIGPENLYVRDHSIWQRRSWTTMVEHTGGVDVCDPDERLQSYSEFLERAAVVEVPSNAAKRILEEEFPKVSFRVVGHADHLPMVSSARRRRSDGKLRVCAIGALGPHKGSDVIAALALDAKFRNLDIEYVLVGYSNDDDLLRSRGVAVTGKYATEKEGLIRVSELQPDLVFIPSIWPETFCYTLSMALKLKVPPVAFNIGAQAERIAPLKWGTLLPIELALDPCKLSDALLTLDIDSLWKSRGTDELAATVA
jgi:GT2 family glycosyltransferase/glycosyltransferase involved in cell wall biosynthesis